MVFTLDRAAEISEKHRESAFLNLETHRNRMAEFRKLSDEELDKLHEEVEQEVKGYFQDMRTRAMAAMNESASGLEAEEPEDGEEEEGEHEEL